MSCRKSCRPALITYEEYCLQQQNCCHGCCFTPCPPPRPPCGVPPCRPEGCKAGEYCFGYRGMCGEKVEVVLPIIKRNDR